MKHKQWLSSTLFRGGIDASHPNYPCLSDAFSNLGYPVQPPANRERQSSRQASASEQQCKEFVQALLAEEVKGHAQVLIAKLESIAPDNAPLQKSVIPIAARATRAILAVLLKHTRALPTVAQLAAQTPTPEELCSEAVVRMWRKANKIKRTLGSIKATQGDVAPFLALLLARVELLLHIQPNTSSESKETDGGHATC